MSKPVQLCVVALVALAGGVLLGMRLAAWGSPSLAATRVELAPRAVEPSERPSEIPSIEGLARPVAVGPISPARTLAPATELSPAPIPSAQLDDARAGPASGTITGTIVTLDGAPLSGVELELEPSSRSGDRRARGALSDERGRFVFAGLPQGTWDLAGLHPEYVLLRKTEFPPRISTGAQVDYVACPGVGVEVHVQGPDAARARVAYRRADEDEPRWASWSPASPRIVLSPGKWELCAFVEPLEDWPSDSGWALAPIASQEHTVHVGTGETPNVVLKLENVNCLFGTLSVPEGHRASYSEPHVVLIEPRHGTRADFEFEGDRVMRYAYPDERMRYGLFRLPCTRWTAGFVIEGWDEPSSAEIVDVSGLMRRDFDGARKESEGSVVVEAFSPAGEPVVAGLSLGLFHRDGGDERDEYVWHPSRTVLEDGGRLRVIALPMNVEEGKGAKKKQQLVLRASLPGFALIEHALSGLNGERVRLSFAYSSTLEVVLLGEDGLRAMRKCYSSLRGDKGQRGGRFDEAVGAIVFDGLEPGPHTLTLTQWFEAGASHRQELVHRGRIDVHAGPQRVTIPMPPRSDLLVRCPEVKQDVHAYLTGVDGDRTEDQAKGWGRSRAQAKVDELGQVLFESVLAGTYRLSIGSRVQLVRVPSAPVDIEGVLPTRHMFRLEQGDSPLRRAGVRSGDTLVAIDGEELSVESARGRLQALSSQSGGSLRLTVIRAGEALDFTLKASDLGPGESFSSSLEPDLE